MQSARHCTAATFAFRADYAGLLRTYMYMCTAERSPHNTIIGTAAADLVRSDAHAN